MIKIETNLYIYFILKIEFMFKHLTIIALSLSLISTSCIEEKSNKIPQSDVTLGDSVSKDSNAIDPINVNETPVQPAIKDQGISNDVKCNCNISFNHKSLDDDVLIIEIHDDEEKYNYAIEGAKLIGYNANLDLSMLTDVNYMIFTEGQNMIYRAEEIEEPDTILANFWLSDFSLNFVNNTIYDGQNSNSKIIKKVSKDLFEFELLDCHSQWIKIRVIDEKDTEYIGWIETSQE